MRTDRYRIDVRSLHTCGAFRRRWWSGVWLLLLACSCSLSARENILVREHISVRGYISAQQNISARQDTSVRQEVLVSESISVCESTPVCENKQLTVKRINSVATPAPQIVPALLDEAGVVFHALGTVNWPAYPYRPEVSFRIAHTGSELLIHYRVTEESVRALADGDNGRVWEDACVEFFVSPEGDDNYYNFECNCVGRLLIQGGFVGARRPLATPEVLSQVRRWSSLGTEPFGERTGPCSWELVMVVPVTAFFNHAIANFDGQTMRANFYKCGDKLAKPHFLSWNPIRLEHPLFHCPEYFGTLIFE